MSTIPSFYLRRLFPPLTCLSLALLTALTAQAADPVPDNRRLVELDKVNVVSTATRSERLLSEVPIRTEVLRNEDITLRATVDFSRAIELINGLRVENNCQNCNTSDVRLLGLEGVYNQLLFDGAPLMSTLGRVYGIEQIPAAFVNRIEVVKGGGSALYGPGAVAGVVNLISQQPTRNGGFVQTGSEWQRHQPTSFFTGRNDVINADGSQGLSVVGQWSKSNPIDFDHDGYTEISEKEMKVAGAQGWYALGENTTLRANYTFTTEERRGGNRLDLPMWQTNITESTDMDYHRGGIYWDQIINDGFDFSLGYSFAHIKRWSYYGGLGDVITDPNDANYDPDELDPNFPGSAAEASFNQYGFVQNPLHYIDSQFNLRQGNHALAFGVQYKRESIRDDKRDATGFTRVRGERERFTNLGVYVQDEWGVNESVDLIFGVRGDKANTLDNVVFSPRVAVAWKTSEQWKLRAGISTGFRAPEIFDEDMHVDTIGGVRVRSRNADDLKEERAVTFMLGTDWRNDEGNVSWDLTTSYTDIKDTFVLSEIQPDPLYPGEEYQLRGNSSGSQVFGLETNFAWQIIDNLRLDTGLAWYNSTFDEAQMIYDDTGQAPPGDETVLESRKYLKNPALTGQAQLAWAPIPLLDTFIGVNYTGKMYALNNNTATLNRTDDFWVVDVGGALHLGPQGPGHWHILFGLRNVFDQRQKDLETGAERDSDYVYGPRFARSYYVSARYNF